MPLNSHLSISGPVRAAVPEANAGKTVKFENPGPINGEEDDALALTYADGEGQAVEYAQLWRRLMPHYRKI